MYRDDESGNRRLWAGLAEEGKGVIARTKAKQTFQGGKPVENRTKAKSMSGMWAISGYTIGQRQH
jgi:hypothetical protein